MTAAIIMGLPMPLLAIHLLWINLVTDGLPALCLATDPIDSDVMKQPPRARSETRPLWRINLFSNLNLLVVVAISFSIQVWSHHNAISAKFLKTSLMSFSECLMLLAVSTVPLLVLEARKVFIRRRPAQHPS